MFLLLMLLPLLSYDRICKLKIISLDRNYYYYCGGCGCYWRHRIVRPKNHLLWHACYAHSHTHLHIRRNEDTRPKNQSMTKFVPNVQNVGQSNGYLERLFWYFISIVVQLHVVLFIMPYIFVISVFAFWVDNRPSHTHNARTTYHTTASYFFLSSSFSLLRFPHLFIEFRSSHFIQSY